MITFMSSYVGRYDDLFDDNGIDYSAMPMPAKKPDKPNTSSTAERPNPYSESEACCEAWEWKDWIQVEVQKIFILLRFHTMCSTAC